VVGAQKILDGRPHTTRVIAGLDDALATIPISGRIYERVGATTCSSVCYTIWITTKFLPATFKSSSVLFGSDGFWI